MLLAACCCAALFLYAVYLGALSVLLPIIGTDFGLEAGVSGRLFPATFTGFVIGVLLCGYLSDRLGRKKVLLLGIALYGAGLALFGNVSVFSLALPAAMLIGAGSGAMETVASALAADLFPNRRALILNLLQVAFGIGAALSPALGHQLLQAGTDWRLFYYGLAAANGALFVLFALQPVPRSAVSAESLDPAALRRVLTQPPFLLLCVGQALYVGAELSYFSWMPTYFQTLPGGKAWEGLVVTVFWSAMTVGRIAIAAIAEQPGVRLPRLIRIIALGALATSALTLLVGRTPLIAVLFVALTGLFLSGIFSLILAEAGERYPRVAGTVFGAVMAVGGVGGALFPWLVGVLAATNLGWQNALLTVPLLAAGVALIAWLLEIARPILVDNISAPCHTKNQTSV